MKKYFDAVTAPEYDKLGISPSMAPFLGTIHHHEGISMKGISEILAMDKALTSRHVTRLIEMGLVENMASGHAYSLRLTDEGLEMARSIKIIVRDAWKGLFDDLTPDEKEVMKTVIDKVSIKIRRALE